MAARMPGPEDWDLAARLGRSLVTALMVDDYDLIHAVLVQATTSQGLAGLTLLDLAQGYRSWFEEAVAPGVDPLEVWRACCSALAAQEGRAA